MSWMARWLITYLAIDREPTDKEVFELSQPSWPGCARLRWMGEPEPLSDLYLRVGPRCVKWHGPAASGSVVRRPGEKPGALARRIAKEMEKCNA